MTVVINMYKTCVMSGLWRCHVSLMHTPSSKVLQFILILMQKNKVTKCQNFYSRAYLSQNIGHSS